MELNETESDSQHRTSDENMFEVCGVYVYLHKHNTDFLLVDLMFIYVVVVLVQVIATRNTRERSNRLENTCWRIWHLARKKKQVMRNLISHEDKVHM